MKKIIILSALALSSTLSIAQSTATDNIDISANVTSGCKISAEDFGFGNITYNAEQTLVKNVKIQCSKGTALELTQMGVGSGTNPFYSPGMMNNFMILNGDGVYGVNNPSWIGYVLNVANVQTNIEYTVTASPENNRLGVREYDGSSYYLGITVKSSNEISLPITALITALKHSKEAGNYADTVTYTLTY